MSDEIITLLKQIVETQQTSPFNPIKQVIVVITASIGFIISLSLNEALKATFDLIPTVSVSKIGAAWIYAVVALTVGILALWLIYGAIQPVVTAKKQKKAS